jgi:hypothetical protein
VTDGRRYLTDTYVKTARAPEIRRLILSDEGQRGGASVLTATLSVVCSIMPIKVFSDDFYSAIVPSWPSRAG